MNKDRYYPDELTAKMHSQFRVSRDIEIKHKSCCVWKSESPNASREEFEKEAFGLSKADEDIVGGEAEEGENGKEKFVLIHGDYSDIGDIADTRDNNEEE